MEYVVLLALIAGFLGLQLYRVLGRRTEHEQPMPKPAEERAPALLPRAIDAAPESREQQPRGFSGGTEAGLRAIIAADSSFDLGRFLDGAKQAYGLILEAFWKGDEATLDWLCAEDVRANFAEAIAERQAAGHVLDNRLVSIEQATISAARLDGREARVTVRFDADIAAVTRDAQGQVIAGSLTDAVTVHELWTFTRTLKSSGSDWKLAETDEA